MDASAKCTRGMRSLSAYLPEGKGNLRRSSDKLRITIKSDHWTKELEADGDDGRHFDNIKMEFIRDHVAPLLMGKPVPGLPK